MSHHCSLCQYPITSYSRWGQATSFPGTCALTAACVSDWPPLLPYSKSFPFLQWPHSAWEPETSQVLCVTEFNRQLLAFHRSSALSTWSFSVYADQIEVNWQGIRYMFLSNNQSTKFGYKVHSGIGVLDIWCYFISTLVKCQGKWCGLFSCKSCTCFSYATFLFLSLDYFFLVSFPPSHAVVGLDIQDEMGRHEVGHIDNSMKIPLNNGDGCRFEGHFSINKVSRNDGELELAQEMLVRSVCKMLWKSVCLCLPLREYI